MIYNRWGEKVFEGKDLNSKWDGTYNGEASDLGVYAVYIGYTINDAKKVLNANVSLLR